MKNNTATLFLRGLFDFMLFAAAGHASAVAMLSFDAPGEAVIDSTIDVDIRISALDAADDVGGFDITIGFDAFGVSDDAGTGLLDLNATDSTIRAVPLPVALLLVAIGLLAMQRFRKA